MRTHTIAICGAGIGGLATAIALDARGHSVTMFEAASALRPIGSGLMLQPTGQAALARLGLLATTLDHGRLLNGITGRTRGGKTIFDLSYSRLDSGAFALGIHRGTLFQILAAECLRRTIPIITGTTIASSHIDGTRRLVCATAAEPFGAYDLVVDAAGIHSPLRDAHARIRLHRPYRYGAVWGVAREPSGWPTPHTLSQVYDGAHTMIGLLPIGRLPGGSEPLTAFFWSLRTADIEKWRATPFRAWQTQVAGLWPAAEPFVRQFRSHADLTPAAYADIKLHGVSCERLVFVGDAAGAASPQLGQGANMALLDAVILADCLGGHATIAAALAAFNSARRAHAIFYGRASRWLTPFFQSDSRLAATVRDHSFAPMARIPFIHREMVRTLAGVKTGLLRHRTPGELAGTPAPPLPPPVT